MKKLSGAAIARIAAIAAVALGIAAVALYREGYYDLSFLPRETAAPSTDLVTEPTKGSETGRETEPPVDTEPTETEPAETEPTLQEQLAAIPTLEQALSEGFRYSTAGYSPGSGFLARVTGTAFPNSYFSARGNVTLSLYMGRILYDDGRHTMLYLPDGRVCAAGIDALTPAYLRDSEGHPLFLYRGNYYYVSDFTNEMCLVDVEGLPKPPFTYNYPADLLPAQRELIPFSVPGKRLHYVDLNGRDITGEVEAAIEAGYLILDPETLEITSFIPWPNEQEQENVLSAALQSEETDPVEPDSTQTEPDTDPAETEPTETAPADTAPDTDPAGTESTETEPADTALDTDPAGTEPTETEPADTALDTDPAGTEPTETEPDTDPAETEPTETEPADTAPDTDPAETEPAETEPVETDPTDTEPTEPALAPWDIYGYPAPDSFTVRVEEITLWGYRKADGTVAIEPVYYFAADFSEGYATVVNENGHLCVINTSGRTVINPNGKVYYLPGRKDYPAKLHYALPETYGTESAGMLYFSHGLLFVRRIYTDYYSEKTISDDNIIIDTAGREFPIPAGYAPVAYTEGRILLSNGERYGIMDTSGKWVVQPIYTYAEPYAGGLAVVGYSGGLKGLVDCDGNIVLPLAYDKIEGAADGVILTYSFTDGWTIYNVMTDIGTEELSGDTNETSN